MRAAYVAFALGSAAFSAFSRPTLAAEPAGGAILVDVTGSTGIAFTHSNGATGEKQYQETMGSGACLIDHDGDGRVDVYLVNCVGKSRLYRNLGGLRFEDVTDRAGVGDAGYGMAAVAGDVDRDGDDDLVVTGFGAIRLWMNRGDGTFREEAAARGLSDARWGCGAAFLDAERDGDLDLYVANYVYVAQPDTNVCLAQDGVLRLVCRPTDYPPAADALYRNRGDGTFENVTEEAGLADLLGRGLGVVVTDYDHDGDHDIYVANDLDPNNLLRNDGHGRFEDVAYYAGVSHSETGRAESGMGVAAGDYDHDGWIDLFVTNFVGQTNTLYHNEGDGFFQDETARSGLGRSSLPYVGWGTDFVDFDGDGWRDVFVVNGHVEPDAARVDDPEGYRQPSFFYRGLGDGTFEDVTDAYAPDFRERTAGRGAAVGDLDDDGDPDLVVLCQNAPARVFENRRAARRWIGLELAGTRSNPNAIGAAVELHAGGRGFVEEVRAGGSFLSCHDRRLLFALGSRAEVDSVIIRWPTGARDVRRGLEPDRYHVLEEPR
ncbi:MAG: CRTAC1 family protein [Candidatus Eiseniibacteriota bacterium]